MSQIGFLLAFAIAIFPCLSSADEQANLGSLMANKKARKVMQIHVLCKDITQGGRVDKEFAQNLLPLVVQGEKQLISQMLAQGAWSRSCVYVSLLSNGKYTPMSASNVKWVERYGALYTVDNDTEYYMVASETDTAIVSIRSK